ncbi:MAG: hypothetical protein GY778_02840 [bacterium]|nr:hypothetical protein [bacterium]
MSLEQKGTVAFWLQHPHMDWQTNNQGYKFGPFSDHGISYVVFKHPDRSLQVVISGPLSRTSTFHTRVPDIVVPQGLHVAITWRFPTVTLYLKGQPVAEIEAPTVVQATLPITISTPHRTPPLDQVGELLESLGVVFNTVSAFLDTPDPASLRAVLEDGLDRSKFGIQESTTGSFKAIISGTKKVFDYVRDKFTLFLAVFTGKAARLAEAHVSVKEAEAAIQQEKANQEKLETMQKAMQVAREFGQHLAETRADMDPAEKEALLRAHFLPSMEQFSKIMTENQMTLTIDIDDSREST